MVLGPSIPRGVMWFETVETGRSVGLKNTAAWRCCRSTEVSATSLALPGALRCFTKVTGAESALLGGPAATPASLATPTAPPPLLHVEDLQLRTNAATPATAHSLLHHCQALVACRWQATLSALPGRLDAILRLQAALQQLPPSAALSQGQMQAVHGEYARHAAHAAMQPALEGSLRMRPGAAARVCHVRPGLPRLLSSKCDTLRVVTVNSERPLFRHHQLVAAACKLWPFVAAVLTPVPPCHGAYPFHASFCM